MAARFALAFIENGCLRSATELFEKVLEASQSTLGSEHPNTLSAMNNLANVPSKKLKKLDKLIGWFKRL